MVDELCQSGRHLSLPRSGWLWRATAVAIVASSALVAAQRLLWPLDGEQWLAGDETFAGGVGVGDLEQSEVSNKESLDGTEIDQGLDRGCWRRR